MDKSPRRSCCVRAALGVALAVLVVREGAWAQAIGQGFELERVGRYQQAASVYLATLRADPTNLSALLGLERVLPPLSRLADLLPVARRAVTLAPSNVALRGVLLRTYVGVNEPDSARAVALRWAADVPHDEAPYREWAMALEDARRHDAARDVLLAGRRAVDRPGTFAVELAELDERVGNWEEAAREWAAALTESPTQLLNAANELAQAPATQHQRIARLLTTGQPSPLTRRLAAELLLGWGEPERAWSVFEPSVTTASADAASALRHFADVAGSGTTPAARRVRGLALARYAAMAPEDVAARARAEAARAFLEAGDRAAARDVLVAVARDSSAPPGAQALAQDALIEALIDEGQLDEAGERLGTDARLTSADRAALRVKLAKARIARGELDLADRALARDSSVDALAVTGWIALYRGRLKDAAQLFRAAGPYAGERRDATERSAMLALIAGVGLDSLPELGAALLLLARPDSAAALRALSQVAIQMGPEDTGRPDILLLAGRIGARLGAAERQTAFALFDEVVRTGGRGAAPPAAELEWARLLLAEQRPAEAIAHLEHLILTYPESAVVPEARRELDSAKGAIPKS